MRYDEREICLKDGRRCVLRSPGAEDGAAMLAYLRQTAEETHFLVRLPEEIRTTEEEEAAFLEERLRPDVRGVMIAAFVEGILAGSVGVNPVGERRKLAHRATVSIAVLQAYWGLGLGRRLMEAALAAAAEMGFSQVELGVFSDNETAIRLYESLGFAVWGGVPMAFRLGPGDYRDEILMGRQLDAKKRL